MISVLVTTDPRYRVDRKLIRKVVAEKLIQEGISQNAEVSVSIVGNRKMRQLAKDFWGTAEDHNVMSFPFQDQSNRAVFAAAPDNILRLGDIVIAHPIAVAEAAEENVLVSDRIKELLEHAVMHLLGHHHDDHEAH